MIFIFYFSNNQCYCFFFFYWLWLPPPQSQVWGLWPKLSQARLLGTRRAAAKRGEYTVWPPDFCENWLFFEGGFYTNLFVFVCQRLCVQCMTSTLWSCVLHPRFWCNTKWQLTCGRRRSQLGMLSTEALPGRTDCSNIACEGKLTHFFEVWRNVLCCDIPFIPLPYIRDEAEMEYLKIAQDLEMYGVSYFAITVSVSHCEMMLHFAWCH